MTAITVLRPDEQARPTEYIGYANRQEVPEGAHLILIENGKPRARDLLRMLADELEARYPIGSVEVFSKPSASKAIEADEAKEMAARAHHGDHGRGRLSGVYRVQFARCRTDRTERDSSDTGDHGAVPGPSGEFLQHAWYVGISQRHGSPSHCEQGRRPAPCSRGAGGGDNLRSARRAMNQRLAGK